MKDDKSGAIVGAVMFGILGVMFVGLGVAFGMMLGRGAERAEIERAEELRQAQAQAYDEGAEFGNGEGWRECIEENNLYDRYMREGSRDTSRI